MHGAIEKFGELVVRRCISEVAMMGVLQWENEDISWATQMITSNIKDIFEMKEQDV